MTVKHDLDTFEETKYIQKETWTRDLWMKLTNVYLKKIQISWTDGGVGVSFDQNLVYVQKYLYTRDLYMYTSVVYVIYAYICMWIDVQVKRDVTHSKRDLFQRPMYVINKNIFAGNSYLVDRRRRRRQLNAESLLQNFCDPSATMAVPTLRYTERHNRCV